MSSQAVPSRRIEVALEDVSGGWVATVTVRERRGGTTHRVQVSRETLDRLAPGATPDALVRASFNFLLEREPAESILREFDVETIGRYFPEYPEEVSRLLPDRQPG